MSRRKSLRKPVCIEPFRLNIKTNKCKKPCRKTQATNPRTNRCVLRSFLKRPRDFDFDASEALFYDVKPPDVKPPDVAQFSTGTDHYQKGKPFQAWVKVHDDKFSDIGEVHQCAVTGGNSLYHSIFLGLFGAKDENDENKSEQLQAHLRSKIDSYRKYSRSESLDYRFIKWLINDRSEERGTILETDTVFQAFQLAMNNLVTILVFELVNRSEDQIIEMARWGTVGDNTSYLLLLSNNKDYSALSPFMLRSLPAPQEEMVAQILNQIKQIEYKTLQKKIHFMDRVAVYDVYLTENVGQALILGLNLYFIWLHKKRFEINKLVESLSLANVSDLSVDGLEELYNKYDIEFHVYADINGTAHLLERNSTFPLSNGAVYLYKEKRGDKEYFGVFEPVQ